MAIHVSFVLDAQVRKDHFIATGRELPLIVETTAPAEDLSREARMILAESGGGLRVLSVSTDGWVSRGLWVAPLCPTTPEEWETLLAAYAVAAREGESQARACYQAQLDKRLAHLRAYEGAERGEAPAALSSDWRGLDGYEEAVALHTALTAQARAAKERADQARRAATAEREAAERAAREARDAAKATWIAEHGSAHLKRAFVAGYDCQRLYVTERSALEHPGYLLDVEDRAEWKARSCPSERALAEAQGVGGRVVWLTRWPDGEDAGDPYDGGDGCEAVAITGYLGKYDLVRSI